MDIDYSVNSELKKLQFFGAGPKAAVPQGGEVKGERANIMIRSKVMNGFFFIACYEITLWEKDFKVHECFVVFQRRTQ